MELRELIAAREELEAKIEAARQEERAAAVAAINKKMTEYRISPEELVSARKRLNPAKPLVPAKYRDPTTGTTWSGRGKPPKWIADKNRDDFLIDPSGAK